MSDYDVIAPFYDIEHAQFDEDVALYENFAELCGQGGRLLELACGSGRLLLPLARAGYTITGVDSSAAMLALARERIQQDGLTSRCTLIQQDIRALQLLQKYPLAFIALGSFGHITMRKDQRQVLQAIRRNLKPGGRFILDISNADARYLEDLSGHVLHQGSWQQEDGTIVTHFISPTSSPTQHLLELTHFYDQHLQGGPLNRTLIKTHLYLFERSELELLLEQAGFVIKEVYGNYALDPYEHESPRMIFNAEVA